MSSDDQKQNKKEPVDIDQLEVGIFIIAKNPDQLKSSAQFLTRRGWPTNVVGNISKAIGAIVKESPDIVLISVDHPNPNVSRLPILLAQTMNTLCIGFTEDGGAISINKLNNSKFKHKFTGFPSGPSIHRFIRQTLDSMYNPQEIQAPKSKKRSGGADDSNTIQVKGEKSGSAIKISGEGPGSAITTKSDAGRTKLKDIQGGQGKDDRELSAAEMLQKLSSGEDYDPIAKQNNRLGEGGAQESTATKSTSSMSLQEKVELAKAKSESEKNKESGDSYFQDVLKNAGSTMTEEEKAAKKARVEAKKKAFPWQKDKNADDVPIKDQKNRPGASFDLSQKKNKYQPDADEPLVASGGKTKSHFDIQQGEKNKTGMYIPEAEERKKQGLPDIPEAGEAGKKKSFEQGASDNLNKKMSEDGTSTESGKVSGNEETTSVGSGEKKKRVNKEFVPQGKKLSKEEDKFKESVHKALKESCEEPDPQVVIEIEEIEKVGVIPVDSQKIHGYFLVARGGIGFSLGTIFLEILSEAVEKHLAMQGIDIHCQKPFLVDTEDFDLDKFAEKIENFTIFEQSGREEIAVTFVPTKDRIPHLQESESSPDMARISAAHLSTEFPINVDSFIFLKKNNRFYKYLNAGAKILPRQKEKLLSKESGASALHINKGEFERFKQYVAEILIYELVTQVNTDDDSGDEGSSDDEAA